MINEIIFLAYMICLIVIAYYWRRKTKTFEDYTVCGRTLPWFVMMCTMAAAYWGGGSTVGLAGKCYEAIWPWFWAVILGWGLFPILIGYFIAPRFRATRAYTVADVFAKYYGSAGGVFCGICSLLVTVGLLGAQVMAIGYIVHVVIGIPLVWGAVFGYGFTVLYTYIGGRYAVAWTDVLQFLMIMFFYSLVGILLLIKVGGFAGLEPIIRGTHLATFPGPLIPAMCLVISFTFGESLTPAYSQVFFSGVDEKHVRKGITIGRAIGPSFYIICLLIGLCAVTLLPPGTPGDEVIPTIVVTALPVGLSGLALAAVAAGSMSTGDSELNSAATIAVRDLVEPFYKLTERGRLLLMKVLIAVLGVGALVVAIALPGVLEALLFSYYFWAPTVWIPVVIALFAKKVSPYAGLASAIVGGTVSSIWQWILGAPYDIEGIIPGMVACLITFVIFHFATIALKPVRGFTPVPIRE